MKKNWMLLAGFFLLSCSERTRVVDYPTVEKTNTNVLEVYCVEVSDTATILHAALYNRPNEGVHLSSEIHLEGDMTGKEYQLKHYSGCNIGEEIVMPVSGCQWVTLQFEPVTLEDEKVSLISQEGNFDLRLDGIRLKKAELPQNAFECILEGEVKDWPECSRLVLIEANKSTESSTLISIPVVDGKFKYMLRDSVNRLYQLFSWHDNINGAYSPVDFISEKGNIHFVLYPKGGKEVSGIVSDLPLNKELQRVKDNSVVDRLFAKRRQLETDKQYYIPEIYVMADKLENESDEGKRKQLMEERRVYFETGTGLTEDAKNLEEEIWKGVGKEKERKIDYVRTNPTLVGLCLYKSLLSKEMSLLKYPSQSKIPLLEELFENIYKDRYAAHPYIQEIKFLLASTHLKKGESFLDFVAPDLSGNNRRLSELIKEKYALLDLWSSWCGPCRLYSKLIIPTYEAYKDKGFTVVGVARESNNTDAVKRAVEQDKYPWMNLVDLNDKIGIWAMYGVQSSSRHILIDPEGKILALDPLPEDVERILGEQLNKSIGQVSPIN